jgi:integrase
LSTGKKANGDRNQIQKTFDKLEDARLFVSRNLAEVEGVGGRAPEGTTLNELCARWLSGKDDVRPVTLEGYEAVLRPVRNRLGRRPVQTLTYDDMLALKGWLSSQGGQRGNPLSERTVRMTFVALGQVLDEGIRARLLTENVARLVKSRRRTGPTDPARWGADDLLAFRRHADGLGDAAAWRLVLSGMRRSEVLGLTWRNVDFIEGAVHVVQGRVPLALTAKSRDHVDAPKSRQSRRIVCVETIHPGTRALLQRYRGGQGRGSESGDFVVVDGTGKPVRPEWFSDRFRRLCAEAGVPVIRLHAVRHSVADLLASLGVPPVDAAALLGHTTSVYLDTYARATTAGTALAAARLGEALGRLAAES